MPDSRISLKRVMSVGSRFLSGFALGAKVGDRARGAKNDEVDVETVQLLLEYAARKLKNPAFDPKGVDGKIARNAAKSSTVKAIVAFQRTIMRNPDGVVDPDGLTHRKLLETVAGAEGTGKDPARSVMASPTKTDGKPSWLPSATGAAKGGGAADPVTDRPKPQKAGVETVPAAGGDEPVWIDVAEDELGVAEDHSKTKHTARVLEYHWSTTQLQKAYKKKPGKLTDEKPWCASFVGWVLEQAGYESAESSWSQSYKRWGSKVSKPCIGCVGVIDWGRVYPDDKKKQGKGHVGFVVGKTKSGRIVLLGGNQSHKVRYSAFRKSHFVAWRMPKDYDVPAALYDLPILKVEKGGGGFADSR